MLRALVLKREISVAQAQLEAALRAELMPQNEEYIIGHQGGGGAQKGLLTNDRIWFVHQRDQNAAIPRHWNAFGLARNLTTSSSNDIVVELNIPLFGHSKHVAGVFVKDDKADSIVLLHRGKVGGGREGVGKSAFLEWYDQKLVEYLVKESGEKEQALLVANFKTDNVVDKIADFVAAVARFKGQIERRALEKIGDELLKKKATKKHKPRKTKTEVTTFSRDQNVVAYVKRRANGKCELCKNRAPFEDTDGQPFLECHHITWLANGGIDSHENAVALCPNCHRKMHVLALRSDIAILRKKAAGE